MARKGGYQERQKPFYVEGFTRRFGSLGHAISYAQRLACDVKEPVDLAVMEWEYAVYRVSRDEHGTVTTRSA